ncbi:adenine nucleotide translocase lysine N-methyltransferase isoform X2 [Hyperolius riggenbachi]|uniref:adenine nucleotide translocase lysine N-methyltransferase isoform X2 n=1 Tax=Hyperolius riggenbachi TaxID=752182 RepID=UPI0035A329F7
MAAPSELLCYGGMDEDGALDVVSELKGKSLGGWGLLQIAGGTGLVAYSVWALVLMPGFRRVPLKLQVLEAARRGFCPAVGYELNPWLIRLSYFYAWKSGYHSQVSYLREDLWKVRLHDCKNVSVFLAPSVLSLLEKKMLEELPDDTRVVAGRFPLPSWAPSTVIGEGAERAWAYDMRTVRQAAAAKQPGTEV